MSLDATLSDVQRYHAIIVSPTELWGDVPAWVRSQFKRHAAHIEQRMRQADTSVCPSKDLHRQHWYYGGQGRYICAICAKIAC